MDRLHSFTVLRAVSFLQPQTAEEGGPTTAAISEYTGMGKHRVATLCGQLSSFRRASGEWIYAVSVEPRRFRLTTLGEQVLNDAHDRACLPQDQRSWTDKKRWPSREKDSQTVNVAIPSPAGVPPGTDPARRGWQDTRPLLEQVEEYEEREAKKYWHEMFE